MSSFEFENGKVDFFIDIYSITLIFFLNKYTHLMNELRKMLFSVAKIFETYLFCTFSIILCIQITLHSLVIIHSGKRHNTNEDILN